MLLRHPSNHILSNDNFSQIRASTGAEGPLKAKIVCQLCMPAEAPKVSVADLVSRSTALCPTPALWHTCVFGRARGGPWTRRGTLAPGRVAAGSRAGWGWQVLRGPGV